MDYDPQVLDLALELPDLIEPSSLALSRDGALMAVADNMGVVALMDRARGTTLTIRAHPDVRGQALALALAPDGRTLVTGGADNSLRFWQTATGDELMGYGELPGAVTVCTFAPDGRTLAVAVENRLASTVRLYRAAAR